MIESLSSAVADRLTLTLLHFLWQGALIGLAYGALLAATSVRSARVRYAVSLIALSATAACPLATFALLDEADSTVTTTTSADQPETSPGRLIAHAVDSRTGVEGQFDQDASAFAAAPAGHGVLGSFRSALDASQPYVLLLWLLGVMVSGARLVTGLVNMVRLRSGQMEIPAALARRSLTLARRLGLQSVRICTSTRVYEAAVVGFFRPVVLLPVSWLTSLPPDVLEAVIAHELAHIRRFDVWVNLLQRILETLLFFHPVVWWLSNRIRLEREMCCDELAVQATGEIGNYAIALEQVGRLQVQGTVPVAPAFTGDGRMNLLSRIQHVLGTRSKPRREAAWLLSIVAVVIPLVLVCSIGIPTSGGVATAEEHGDDRATDSEAEPGRSADDEGRPQQTDPPEPQEVPEELRGLGAMFLGRLVSRDIERGEFVLTVDHVPRVWRNNRAEVPRAAVGKTFLIEGVSGQFLDRLLLIEPGETMRVAVQHQRGDRFTFPGEGFEKAEPFDPDDYPAPPDGFRGFRGIVTGTIVGKTERSRELTIRIDEIERVLDASRADDAESGIGETVVVGGFWQQQMRERFERFKDGDAVRVGIDHQVPASDGMRVIEVAERIRSDEPDADAPAGTERTARDSDTPGEPQEIPRELRGFSGMLLGRLVSRDVERGEFTVTVDYIPRVWRNNRAERPRSAVGKTFLVDGVSGRFLDRLLLIDPGETLRFEAQQQRNDRLTFPGELLEKAEAYDADNYPVPPDKFRGFRGIVIGTIVSKREDSLELTLKIDRVERVLDDNRADDVESGIGASIVVAGFWRERLRKSYEGFEVGDSLRVGLHHQVTASDHVSVIELAEKVAGDNPDSDESAAIERELDDVGFPVGMHGFRGILTGRLVDKDIEEGTLTFVAERVNRVWRQNEATDLESCQDHTFVVEGISGRWLDVLITIEKDDRLEVEAFHNGGAALDFVQEHLKKVE